MWVHCVDVFVHYQLAECASLRALPVRGPLSFVEFLTTDRLAELPLRTSESPSNDAPLDAVLGSRCATVKKGLATDAVVVYRTSKSLVSVRPLRASV